MFSVRIVKVDHYIAPPIRGLDICYSEFRNCQLTKVPVIRIFGPTPAGQKVCVHLHGTFPYIYIPYDGTEPADRYMHQLAVKLDQELTTNQAGNDSAGAHWVHKIELVSGIPFYGYHAKEHQFLKIYFLSPQIIERALELLQNGAIMNHSFQPHEAHIPYILQVFIDYNLYGMNLIKFQSIKFRRKSATNNTVTSKSSVDFTESCHLLNTLTDSPNGNFKLWDPDNLPSAFVSDDSIMKQSTCELEVDVLDVDVINSLDFAGSDMNPGIAAIWEDERQRRRQMNQLSQITPPCSQDRQPTVRTRNEVEYLEKVGQKLCLVTDSQEMSLLLDESQVHGKSGMEAKSQHDSDKTLNWQSQKSANENSLQETSVIGCSQSSNKDSILDDSDFRELLLDLLETESVNSDRCGRSRSPTPPLLALKDADENDEITMSQIVLDDNLDVCDIPISAIIRDDSKMALNDSIPQVDGPNDPKDKCEGSSNSVSSDKTSSMKIRSSPRKILDNAKDILNHGNIEPILIEKKCLSVSSPSIVEKVDSSLSPNQLLNSVLNSIPKQMTESESTNHGNDLRSGNPKIADAVSSAEGTNGDIVLTDGSGSNMESDCDAVSEDLVVRHPSRLSLRSHAKLQRVCVKNRELMNILPIRKSLRQIISGKMCNVKSKTLEVKKVVNTSPLSSAQTRATRKNVNANSVHNLSEISLLMASNEAPPCATSQQRTSRLSLRSHKNVSTQCGALDSASSTICLDTEKESLAKSNNSNQVAGTAHEDFQNKQPEVQDIEDSCSEPLKSNIQRSRGRRRHRGRGRAGIGLRNVVNKKDQQNCDEPKEPKEAVCTATATGVIKTWDRGRRGRGRGRGRSRRFNHAFEQRSAKALQETLKENEFVEKDLGDLNQPTHSVPEDMPDSMEEVPKQVISSDSAFAVSRSTPSVGLLSSRRGCRGKRRDRWSFKKSACIISAKSGEVPKLTEPSAMTDMCKPVEHSPLAEMLNIAKHSPLSDMPNLVEHSPLSEMSNVAEPSPLAEMPKLTEILSIMEMPVPTKPQLTESEPSALIEVSNLKEPSTLKEVSKSTKTLGGIKLSKQKKILGETVPNYELPVVLPVKRLCRLQNTKLLQDVNTNVWRQVCIRDVKVNVDSSVDLQELSQLGFESLRIRKCHSSFNASYIEASNEIECLGVMSDPAIDPKTLGNNATEKLDETGKIKNIANKEAEDLEPPGDKAIKYLHSPIDEAGEDLQPFTDKSPEVLSLLKDKKIEDSCGLDKTIVDVHQHDDITSKVLHLQREKAYEEPNLDEETVAINGESKFTSDSPAFDVSCDVIEEKDEAVLTDDTEIYELPPSSKTIILKVSKAAKDKHGDVNHLGPRPVEHTAKDRCETSDLWKCKIVGHKEDKNINNINSGDDSDESLRITPRGRKCHVIIDSSYEEESQGTDSSSTVTGCKKPHKKHRKLRRTASDSCSRSESDESWNSKRAKPESRGKKKQQRRRIVVCSDSEDEEGEYTNPGMRSRERRTRRQHNKSYCEDYQLDDFIVDTSESESSSVKVIKRRRQRSCRKLAYCEDSDYELQDVYDETFAAFGRKNYSLRNNLGKIHDVIVETRPTKRRTGVDYAPNAYASFYDPEAIGVEGWTQTHKEGCLDDLVCKDDPSTSKMIIKGSTLNPFVRLERLDKETMEKYVQGQIPFPALAEVTDASEETVLASETEDFNSRPPSLTRASSSSDDDDVRPASPCHVSDHENDKGSKDSNLGDLSANKASSSEYFELGDSPTADRFSARKDEPRKKTQLGKAPLDNGERYAPFEDVLYKLAWMSPIPENEKIVVQAPVLTLLRTHSPTEMQDAPATRNIITSAALPSQPVSTPKQSSRKLQHDNPPLHGSLPGNIPQPTDPGCAAQNTRQLLLRGLLQKQNRHANASVQSIQKYSFPQCNATPSSQERFQYPGQQLPNAGVHSYSFNPNILESHHASTRPLTQSGTFHLPEHAAINSQQQMPRSSLPLPSLGGPISTFNMNALQRPQFPESSMLNASDRCLQPLSQHYQNSLHISNQSRMQNSCTPAASPLHHYNIPPSSPQGSHFAEYSTPNSQQRLQSAIMSSSQGSPFHAYSIPNSQERFQSAIMPPSQSPQRSDFTEYSTLNAQEQLQSALMPPPPYLRGPSRTGYSTPNSQERLQTFIMPPAPSPLGPRFADCSTPNSQDSFQSALMPPPPSRGNIYSFNPEIIPSSQYPGYVQTSLQEQIYHRGMPPTSPRGPAYTRNLTAMQRPRFPGCAFTNSQNQPMLFPSTSLLQMQPSARPTVDFRPQMQQRYGSAGLQQNFHEQFQFQSLQAGSSSNSANTSLPEATSVFVKNINTMVSQTIEFYLNESPKQSRFLTNNATRTPQLQHNQSNAMPNYYVAKGMQNPPLLHNVSACSQNRTDNYLWNGAQTQESPRYMFTNSHLAEAHLQKIPPPPPPLPPPPPQPIRSVHEIRNSMDSLGLDRISNPRLQQLLDKNPVYTAFHPPQNVRIVKRRGPRRTAAAKLIHKMCMAGRILMPEIFFKSHGVTVRLTIRSARSVYPPVTRPLEVKPKGKRGRPRLNKLRSKVLLSAYPYNDISKIRGRQRSHCKSNMMTRKAAKAEEDHPPPKVPSGPPKSMPILNSSDKPLINVFDTPTPNTAFPPARKQTARRSIGIRRGVASTRGSFPASSPSTILSPPSIRGALPRGMRRGRGRPSLSLRGNASTRNNNTVNESLKGLQNPKPKNTEENRMVVTRGRGRPPLQRNATPRETSILESLALITEKRPEDIADKIPLDKALENSDDEINLDLSPLEEIEPEWFEQPSTLFGKPLQSEKMAAMQPSKSEEKDESGLHEEEDQSGWHEEKDESGWHEEKDESGWHEEKDGSGWHEEKDGSSWHEEKAGSGRHEEKGGSGFHKEKDESGWHEEKDESGWHEEKDESGWHEEKDESGWHEEKDESGWHEEKDESGWHEEKDESGWREKKDPSGWREKKDPSGWREKKDPSGWREKKDPSGWREKKDPSGWHEKKDTSIWDEKFSLEPVSLPEEQNNNAAATAPTPSSRIPYRFRKKPVVPAPSFEDVEMVHKKSNVLYKFKRDFKRIMGERPRLADDEILSSLMGTDNQAVSTTLAGTLINGNSAVEAAKGIAEDANCAFQSAESGHSGNDNDRDSPYSSPFFSPMLSALQFDTTLDENPLLLPVTPSKRYYKEKDGLSCLSDCLDVNEQDSFGKNTFNSFITLGSSPEPVDHLNKCDRVSKPASSSLFGSGMDNFDNYMPETPCGHNSPDMFDSWCEDIRPTPAFHDAMSFPVGSPPELTDISHSVVSRDREVSDQLKVRNGLSESPQDGLGYVAAVAEGISELVNMQKNSLGSSSTAEAEANKDPVGETLPSCGDETKRDDHTVMLERAVEELATEKADGLTKADATIEETVHMLPAMDSAVIVSDQKTSDSTKEFSSSSANVIQKNKDDTPGSAVEGASNLMRLLDKPDDFDLKSTQELNSRDAIPDSNLTERAVSDNIDSTAGRTFSSEDTMTEKISDCIDSGATGIALSSENTIVKSTATETDVVLTPIQSFYIYNNSEPASMMMSTPVDVIEDGINTENLISQLTVPKANVLSYFIPPPSPAAILSSMTEYKIPEIHHPVAHCSNVTDVPTKSVQLGGGAVVLKLQSKSVSDLPEFDGPLCSTGLNHWCQVIKIAEEAGYSCSNDCLKKMPYLGKPLLHQGLCFEFHPRPPLALEVQKWLAEKVTEIKYPEEEKGGCRKIESASVIHAAKATIFSATEISPISHPAKYRAYNMNGSKHEICSPLVTSVVLNHGQKKRRLSFSCDHELCKESNDDLKLCSPKPDSPQCHVITSPCSHRLKRSFSDGDSAEIGCSLEDLDMSGSQSPTGPIAKKMKWTSSTPHKSTPARESCFKMRSPAQDLVQGSQGFSLRRQLFLQQMKTNVQTETSQLQGPTPKNTYGFKMSGDVLQDTKSIHVYQHITLMSMELHVQTDEDLCPNPQNNAICAVFYHVHHDIPVTCEGECNRRERLTGIIIVEAPPTVRANNAFQKSASEGPLANDEPLVVQNSESSFHKHAELIEAGVDILIVQNEFILIQEFVKIMQEHDPDILLGYEIQMLSWGYLCERCGAIGIKLCPLLSRVPDDSMNKFRPPQEGIGDTFVLNIVGRIILNVWQILKSELALYNYSFENLAYHILHKRIPLFSFRTLTLWYGQSNGLNRWRTLQHYIIRAKGNVQLLEQLNFIGKTSELARVFGIQFYEVLSRGSQFRVESMLLRQCRKNKYIAVSPSVQQRSTMRSPEYIPLVMEPVSKFHTNPVVVLDFQSLYPSIIIAYNYCFSTCIGRVEDIGQSDAFQFGCTSLKIPSGLLKKFQDRITVAPCGVAFVKSEIRKGILPRMLEEILSSRIMVKTTMKRHTDDKTLYSVLDARQLGLKLISNVTYGYTAANFSGRMPCVEVADSVVSKGRETLERAISLIHDTVRWNAKVIYGDTDSVFVLLEGRSKEQAFAIGKEIALAVTADNPKPVKLKLEKVYLPCVLETKKRYVGNMYETPDQVNPVFDAKGIETIRRDGCPAVAKILEKSLRILFKTHDVTQVKIYVQNQFHKILMRRCSVNDYIFTREYHGKNGYRHENHAPAFKIARSLMQSDCRAEPRVGERVPYVVTYGSPGSILLDLICHPHEVLLNSSLCLNSKYYINNAICPALDRVFSLIGADVRQWYSTLPRAANLPLPIENPSRESSTILHHFTVTKCPVCEASAHSGICSNCLSNPQKSLVVLTDRIRQWERRYQQVSLVCQSCTGTTDQRMSCVSLNCPIFFRLSQSSKDLAQAPYLRGLLKKASVNW